MPFFVPAVEIALFLSKSVISINKIININFNIFNKTVLYINIVTIVLTIKDFIKN